VTAVRPLPGFRLEVTFIDGTTGEVDLRRLLQRPNIGGTVFAPLRETRIFEQAGVVLGVVTWPGGGGPAISCAANRTHTTTAIFFELFMGTNRF